MKNAEFRNVTSLGARALDALLLAPTKRKTFPVLV